jgi:hypothetical protein
MAPKRAKPARGNGTGSGWNSLAASDRNNSKPLPEVQSDFLAARFGLDATRAKLTAELCWRRS